MPSGKIQEKLNGFTSDHGWQTIAVTDSGPSGDITLRGLTWNTLNKGHEKGSGAYSNNPYDIEEDPKDYLERKQQQFAELLVIIKERSSGNNPEPLDFMLLQEVNAFTNRELYGAKGPPVVLPIRGLKEAVDEFKNELAALGWNIEITSREVNCKPMVTLYNTSTLERDGPARGLFPESGKKNTGFELPFKHITSGKPVAITNLHLAYGEDSSEALLAYQFEQIQKGVFTVMGGDTNHPPNYQLEGLMGNFHYVTNVDEDPNNPGKVTDRDERSGTSYTKHYDGFFCSPGGKDHQVSSKETEGVCFEVNNGIAKPRVYDPSEEYPEYAQHQAPTQGVPWIRRASLDRLMPYVDNNTKAQLESKKIKVNQTVQTQTDEPLIGIIFEQPPKKPTVGIVSEVDTSTSPTQELFRATPLTHARNPVINNPPTVEITSLKLDEFLARLKEPTFAQNHHITQIDDSQLSSASPKISFDVASKDNPLKTAKCYAEQGSSGIKISMDKIENKEEKELALQRLCFATVDALKPGEEIVIPSKSPDRELLEKFLNQALKQRFEKEGKPDLFVEYEFKIPTVSKPEITPMNRGGG